MAGTVATLRVFVDRKLVPEDQEDGSDREPVRPARHPGGGHPHRRSTTGAREPGSRSATGDSSHGGVFVLEHIERLPRCGRWSRCRCGSTPWARPPPTSSATSAPRRGGPEPHRHHRSTTAWASSGSSGTYDRLLRGTPGRSPTRSTPRARSWASSTRSRRSRAGASSPPSTSICSDSWRTTLTTAIALARQDGEPVKRAVGGGDRPERRVGLAMASRALLRPSGVLRRPITTDRVGGTQARRPPSTTSPSRALYPPGSSFKTIVAYTWHWSREDLPGHWRRSTRTPSTGRTTRRLFYLRRRRCSSPTRRRCNDWKPGGHGLVNIATRSRRVGQHLLLVDRPRDLERAGRPVGRGPPPGVGADASVSGIGPASTCPSSSRASFPTGSGSSTTSRTEPASSGRRAAGRAAT